MAEKVVVVGLVVVVGGGGGCESSGVVGVGGDCVGGVVGKGDGGGNGGGGGDGNGGDGGDVGDGDGEGVMKWERFDNNGIQQQSFMIFYQHSGMKGNCNRCTLRKESPVKVMLLTFLRDTTASGTARSSTADLLLASL